MADNYNINANERWKFGPQPADGLEEYVDIVGPAMLIFRDLGFQGDVVSGGGGQVLDVDDNLIKVAGVAESIKYNQVQTMINGGVLSCIAQLKLLRTVSENSSAGEEGYLDPAHEAADSTWWDDVQAIEDEAENLLTAHLTWRAAYSDGVADNYTNPPNPSALATTFQSAVKVAGQDFYNTCFASTTGRLDVIEARFGDTTTAGYIKDLYDAANVLAGKNVGYVRDAYSDLFSISSYYDRIEDLREKYRNLERSSNN
jgi:hypothetical protein